MSEWKEIFLRDVCAEISYGYTASATHQNTGVKFLRITDIVNTPFNWDTVPYCEISTKDTEKYKLYPGDIVIARTGATTGTTFTITDETKAVFASYLIRYKIDITRANPYFIGHNLKSEQWKGYVENIIGGSAQPGANAQQFADYELLLPPLPEQERIAEVLSSLDDKIDLLHRQNKTLEEMTETLFRQWFVEEAEEEIVEISLSDISKHVKRSINPSKSAEQLFKHYSLPSFDNGRNPEIQFGRDILSNKYQISPGQILISKLNPRTPRVWFINSCDNHSICSTEFQVYEPIKKEYTEFIYCLLKSNDTRDILTGASSGTSGSHQRVNPEDINKLSIKKPYEERIKQFHQIASVWLNKIYKNSVQIQQLETLRDTLLPKLMSGQIICSN